MIRLVDLVAAFASCISTANRPFSWRIMIPPTADRTKTYSTLAISYGPCRVLKAAGWPFCYVWVVWGKNVSHHFSTIFIFFHFYVGLQRFTALSRVRHSDNTESLNSFPLWIVTHWKDSWKSEYIAVRAFVPFSIVWTICKCQLKETEVSALQLASGKMDLGSRVALSSWIAQVHFFQHHRLVK